MCGMFRCWKSKNTNIGQKLIPKIGLKPVGHKVDGGGGSIIEFRKSSAYDLAP